MIVTLDPPDDGCPLPEHLLMTVVHCQSIKFKYIKSSVLVYWSLITPTTEQVLHSIVFHTQTIINIVQGLLEFLELLGPTWSQQLSFMFCTILFLQILQFITVFNVKNNAVKKYFGEVKFSLKIYMYESRIYLSNPARLPENKT